VLAAGSFAVFACSTAATLAASGGHCNTVEDCQDGLVCCNGNKGSFTCMSSAACIQPGGSGTVDSGNPATGDDATATGDATGPMSQPDATRQPDTSTRTPESSTTPDSSTPPVEASTPEDTGTPPQEAAPPPDAGDMEAAAD
jgi:hypothetical protein